MVFYLLGECANESLGLRLDGIKVEGNDLHRQARTVLEPKGGSLYVNTPETIGKTGMNSKRFDFAAGVAGKLPEKRKIER